MMSKKPFLRNESNALADDGKGLAILSVQSSKSGGLPPTNVY
jgi:hypothetical protein